VSRATSRTIRSVPTSKIRRRRSESLRIDPETGEILVRVVRIDLTFLRVSHRLRWLLTFSDGRVGYVKREREARFFYDALDRALDLGVTLEEEFWVKGLPPVVDTVVKYEPADDDGEQPF
jgi:hypothetical protein